jgi:uncharacterized protein YuzE
MTITLEVDNEADAAYVTISGDDVARTAKLDENRIIDYDASGAVVGIELLNVSRGVDLRDLPYREELVDLLGQKYIRQVA